MVRVAAAAVLLAGCDRPIHGDPGESWSITINLAADATAGWSDEAPGQLFLGFGGPAVSSEQLLCDEADHDHQVVVEGGGIGCAEERPVEAWVQAAAALVDRFDEPVECGVASHAVDGEIERPEGAAVGTAVLFDGQVGCGGDDRIALVVALPT